MQPTKKIVFQGKILANFNQQQVQENLEKRLKLPKAQIDKFFTGQSMVIKKNLTEQQAQQYLDLLMAAGLDVIAEDEVEAEEIMRQQPAKPQQSQSFSLEKDDEFEQLSDVNNTFADYDDTEFDDENQVKGKLTIDQALARDYDFEIGDILKEAWNRISGFKLNFFLICLISGAINIAFVALGIVIPLLPSLISMMLGFVLGGGVALMVLSHLRTGTSEIGQLFAGFSDKAVTIILASLLMYILIVIGFLFFILPGIYLSLAYILMIYVIMDQPNVGVWQALETSRKLISKHWFKVFFLFLAWSAIPLVIVIIVAILAAIVVPAFAASSVAPILILLIGIGVVIFLILLFMLAVCMALSVGIIYRRIFEPEQVSVDDKQ